MKPKYIVRIKDALFNLNPTSGATAEYRRGIVLGVVSTLMAYGFSFDASIDIVKHNLPSDVAPGSFPEAWADTLGN